MAIGVIGGRTSAISALLILMASTPLWADEPMTGYPVEPISFEKVQLADEFWLPRLRTQRRVLVPFAFEQTSKALHDHELAARVIAGGDPRRVAPEEYPQAHRYRPSDLYKVMEGAAYLLALERDEDLERQMDAIIDVVASAQEPDGYLFPARTLYPKKQVAMMGNDRYAYVDHSHELYNLGHLYEAAVAYYRATGKRALLDVAERSAQHVNRVFFEGDPNYNGGKPKNQAPGHEEIELALVRLAGATGNPRYLKMAQRFLDIRGVTYVPEGEGVFSATYAQQHEPVARQSQPAGHAVRATYLYSGMADVGAMLGTDRYSKALESIWNDLADTRMHITGGLGAVHGIEGFGPQYFLPNADAFNETCAAVGNVLFNERMFLLHRDAQYLDVAEVALYNNVLAGVNFGGDRFFYVNPLAADGTRPFNHGHAGRAPWFNTACCPTNLARLIPQVPGMLYARDGDGLYLCLYGASRTKARLGGVETEIEQRTDYPYDGKIVLQLTPERDAEFAVRLRIPTWATDRFLPGRLYAYADDQGHRAGPRISVNGEPVDCEVSQGFAVIDRVWRAGDVIELVLPMAPRAVNSREEVEANRGRIAVVRGPLVYAAEAVDNDAGHVFNYLVKGTDVASAREEPLEIADHRVLALDVRARRLAGASTPHEEERLDTTLRLIPYYAWNNRAPGAMAVWFADNPQALAEGAIRIDDNARRFHSAKATHTFSGDSESALIDGRLPSSSSDASIPRWTSWPERGQEQSVELALRAPATIRGIEVYWYDDRGGVRLPERWSVEVWREGEWRPLEIYNTDSYGTSADQFNVVHPAEPLTIDRFRLKLTPRKDAAVGILEVVVRPDE